MDLSGDPCGIRPAGEDPRPPRRIQLFVNPVAGSWGRRAVAALTAAFETAGAVVVATPSHGESLTIADGIDHVCAVGGDGTARHVAAAIARVRWPVSMSVYPLGTVNLIARECGYRTDPAAFVRRATAAAAGRRHHVALVGDVPMLACASVGPDSRAVALLSPRLKRRIGRIAYLVAFCGVLARWPRRRLRIVADGRVLDCEAVYVAKGRLFAGRWSFAPQAALDSPLLHVVAVEHATRHAMLRFALALLRGRPPRAVVRFTCTELTIEGDASVPLQADGDIVAHLPARIVVAPDTIAFS